MKFISFAAVLLTAFSTPVFAAGKSFAAYAELTQLIEQMSESASGGASLSFFGYSEEVKANCTPSVELSKNELVKEFSNLADDMFYGGEPAISEEEFQELKRKALPQFRQLIGRGPFKSCGFSASGTMSAGQVTVYIGRDYSFMVEIGSED